MKADEQHRDADVAEELRWSVGIEEMGDCCGSSAEGHHNTEAAQGQPGNDYERHKQGGI